MRLGVVLGAVSLLSIAAPAGAVVLNSCTSGCVTNFGIIFNLDYTVPTDGLTYRWDLWTDPANPGVTINLPSPNEDFALTTVSNGDGTFHQDFSAAAWSWSEAITPGHTTIITRSLGADYNNCTSSTPLGVACAASYNVWGNGVTLTVNTLSPVTVFFAQSVVPEPRTWALAILGLGAAGAMLRRRRAAALAST